MSHKLLKPFIVKVSVLGYFTLYIYIYIYIYLYVVYPIGYVYIYTVLGFFKI